MLKSKLGTGTPSKGLSTFFTSQIQLTTKRKHYSALFLQMELFLIVVRNNLDEKIH